MDPKVKNPPSELYTVRCTIFCKTRGFIQEKNISSVGFLTPLLFKQGVGGMSIRMLKKGQKLVYKNLNQYVKCVCMDVDAREGGRGST